MKRSGIKKNNRGDSLILVIGAIALLSLLGIVILAKTLDNQTMKLAEEKSQETFFKADSSSSEMATALETTAQDAIERAFFDMLIEYSLSSTDDARKTRFSDFFVEYLSKELTDPDDLQAMLTTALGAGVSDLTVTYDGITTEDPEGGVVDAETKVVRIRNAKFDYTANGSKTSITTDICVQAKIPDVLAGFSSGMNCDFSNFAIITDGGTTINGGKTLDVIGNMYVGTDVTVGDGASTTKLTVAGADKMLVRNDILVEDNGEVTVNYTGGGLTGGQGIWANGIDVKGGSLTTSGVNLYVADDLTVEGENTKVQLVGTGNEYVGYSGNTTATQNHEKSSAITVNTVSGNTILDFGALGKLLVNGTSYIRDDKWVENVEGILQGESIAYKDMQAMYLVPGDCLDAGHNPIISSGDVTIEMSSNTHTIEENGVTVYSMDLTQYVDCTSPQTKLKTRKMNLDGTQHANYAYLNFASVAHAVKYVQDYLASPMADIVKSQIKNLGSGSLIKLPTDTITMANAIAYDGTDLEVRPAADAAQSQVLTTSSLIAKQRYGGLFSSLRLGTGIAPAVDFKILKDAILTPSEYAALQLKPNGLVEDVWMFDPEDSTKHYGFVVYKGDLVIDGSSPYKELNGIILVDGTVTLSMTTQINGLILATGGVVSSEFGKVAADSRAVEMLLTKDAVAKYFKGFADDTTGGYLSSEAIDVKFENWKRN